MNVEDTNQDRPVRSLPEESNPEQPQSPKRGWRKFFWPAVIGLVLLGGIGWLVFTRIILPLIFLSQMKPQITQVELGQPKSVTVDESSDYAATLDSRQSVTLQPRVSGQISAIYVKAGDRVEAGQQILQIDATEQQAQVQSRVAAAETSAAEVEAARADVASARDTLRSLQAQRASSASNVQLSRREYERYQDLYNQGAASRQVLDQRLNALQTAQAALSQVEANIRAQQGAIARSQATVVRNQRSLQQAQANINEGQAQLRYYTISAPFSGIVGDIPVKVGDFVENATQLLTITQNEQLEVQVAVSLDRAPELKRGLPVQLLNNQNKVLQTGQIFFISPDVDPASQTVLTKAVFENPGGKLRAEQFTRARVIWNSRPGVLVPTSSISRLAGKNFIFVAKPFNDSGCKAPAQAQGAPAPAKVDPNQLVAVQKNIQLGKIIGNDQEVLEGLTASDSIITSGILNVQNCLPIEEASEPANAS